MKEEDKKILLTDLCGRFPYGVIVECNDNDGSLSNIWKIAYINVITEEAYLLNTETTATKLISVEDIKPCLFPLSSMTEEQITELADMGWYVNDFGDYEITELLPEYRLDVNYLDCAKLVEWLIKNHFDFMGLIEKNLAIDATNLNIY